MKKQTLWCRNYSLLMLATTLGSIGGIAGSYALSFLVFDETGSTLATGFLAALQVVPHFLFPIVIAPWMDRMRRKPVLVCGDLIGGILYGLVALYLRKFEFSYGGYLVFSLVTISQLTLSTYGLWLRTVHTNWRTVQVLLKFLR